MFRITKLDTFLGRLTGGLTRQLTGDDVLLFSPGGTIHTFFMSICIDVAFLDEDYCVKKVVQNVRPWRVIVAPMGTRYTLESAAGQFNSLLPGLKVPI